MKFKLNIQIILLTLIVLLAGVLRFYKLGQVPAGMEWDELAIGYDAYSILKTGRDQFGQRLPITFRSLDDYKPPLYEYLAVLPIAIFGLTAFATRFPSAFFGTLSVLVCYLLVNELFPSSLKLRKGKVGTGNLVALIAAFLFAISPWHLQFSRAAFEVNLSVFLVIMAVWSFLKGLQNSRFFHITAIFAGLGLFSYHSTRVVLPLLMLFLTFAFWKKLPQLKKLAGPLIIFAIFFLPFLMIAFSAETQMRLKVTGLNNLFNQWRTLKDVEKDAAVDRVTLSDWRFRIFHGQKAILARTIIDNYVSHFDPGFLFSHADVVLHHAPGFGLLYRSELPFLVIGLISFFKKYNQPKSRVLPFWFFIAPLPAAITMQVPHAVRTELFLPTFQVFTALGLVEVFVWFKKKIKWLVIPVLILAGIFLAYDVATYLHQYYVHTDYEVGKYWLCGREEAAKFTESVKDDYDQVIVSTNLEMPHVAWLFYLKYNPHKYLAEGGTVSGGWAEYENHFDKYRFDLIDRQEGWKKEKNTLFVDIAGKLPDHVQALKNIYFPSGEKGIVAWESIE
ncbi:glycosyltransferase family 39 protein [Patescibacteria group bacterium]|nr:glycosyltransferase family 39 protein [Patescibacteria group bacterium]MBU1931217.1 glycosyltransferase family 39 protein [Patescibacteria group bacterium]